MVGLLTPSKGYKPFRYPWAFEYWQRQQQVHWMPEEVPLGEDIKDFRTKLSDDERDFVINIFRFFTQSDIDVNENYMESYAGLFKPTEVKMMLSAFSNIETVHIAAYSLLMETIGMPDSEYHAFMDYAEMRDKHDFLMRHKGQLDSKSQQLLNMAIFGAFTEGMQLFASFAMLMNFARFNKMQGMCQIVSWSIRDETLHCLGITKLFREYAKELGVDVRRQLAVAISEVCEEMIRLEDAFIDRAFDFGKLALEGLTAEDMKAYVRYIADIRLEALGLDPIYDIGKHPLPWLPPLITGVEHSNFFEQRSTEYSKGATRGSWPEVWGRFDG